MIEVTKHFGSRVFFAMSALCAAVTGCAGGSVSDVERVDARKSRILELDAAGRALFDTTLG